MEGKDGKRPLEDGFVPPEKKKKRKSQSLVHILESAYTATPKPSAEVKNELAKMTGLNFKQVQAWFGNRRSLDQNGPRVYKSKNSDAEKHTALTSSSSEYPKDGTVNLLNPQPLSIVTPPDMQPEMFSSTVPLWRMQSGAHSPQMPEGQLPWELQSKLREVEGKLGHPVIAEGPELGVKFMPLPPDAFAATLESTPKIGVNERDLNQAMQNNNSQDNSKRLGHLKGYGNYIVRARKTSKSRPEATDKSETSYFHSDIGGSEGTIIAEWNESEKRAEYAIYNNVCAMSESDSNYSD